jgi:pilus assembly protein Flp/PilA
MFKPSSIRQAIFNFLAEEDGPTAVEYAVMLALIIGVCFVSVSFLASQTAASFDTSAAAIAGAFGN